MKIRNGFVSNSSTSSFVVKFRNAIGEESKSMMANRKDIKKLVEYGFVLTGTANPFDVDKIEWKLKDKKFAVALRYDVTCNEDFVITFLVGNNIPFKASVHYDNYLYVFSRGDKFLSKFINMGQIVAMYGMHYFEEFYSKTEKIVENVSIKNFLYDKEDQPYSDREQNGIKVNTKEAIELIDTSWGE